MLSDCSILSVQATRPWPEWVRDFWLRGRLSRVTAVRFGPSQAPKAQLYSRLRFLLRARVSQKDCGTGNRPDTIAPAKTFCDKTRTNLGCKSSEFKSKRLKLFHGLVSCCVNLKNVSHANQSGERIRVHFGHQLKAMRFDGTLGYS